MPVRPVKEIIEDTVREDVKASNVCNNVHLVNPKLIIQFSITAQWRRASTAQVDFSSRCLSPLCRLSTGAIFSTRIISTIFLSRRAGRILISLMEYSPRNTRSRNSCLKNFIVFIKFVNKTYTDSFAFSAEERETRSLIS